MTESVNGFVLWAIPRFHRALRQQPRQDNAVNAVSVGGAAYLMLESYPVDLLRVISEAVAENPEAADCLYASH